MTDQIKYLFWLMWLMISMAIQAQNVNDGFAPTANDWVRVYHQQTDGKILVGGRFTVMGHGITRNRIARLHANGALDMDFDPNANGEVVAIVQESSGYIYVSGGFTEINGQPRSYIAGLNFDGSLIAEFDVASNGGIWAMSYISNGIDDDKILIAGSFNQINGVTRNRIAMLNTDGTLDLSFDPGSGAENAAIFSLLVQHDGKIVVGGSFSTFDGLPLRNAVRLNDDGSLDGSFQPNPNGAVLSIAQQADQKVILGGNFIGLAGSAQNYLARFMPNGQLDTTFVPIINDQVSVIKVAPNGDKYIGGAFTEVNGEPYEHLAKFAETALNGTILSSFKSGHQAFANDQIDALLVQTDGKILVGGKFTESLGEQKFRMARFYSGGELDRRFTPLINGQNSTVNSTVQYTDLFVAGSFLGMNVELHSNIAKLSMDGSNDEDFEAQTNGEVLAMLALPNPYQGDGGQLLLGGKFTQINGLSANHVARISANTGTLDTTFNAFTNGDVHALLHLEDENQYLIAGQFTQVNGQTRNNIALLNDDGTLDMDFTTSVNNRVNAMVMMPDGKVVLGGVFTEVNGFERQKIARLLFFHGNGLVDSFDPFADGSVTSLLVQNNGFLWVGGFFDHIGGEARRGLAVLTADGDVRANMDLPLNTTGFVKSMAMQANGSVIIGGQISSVDGLVREGSAKISWSPSAQQYVVDDWTANSNGNVNNVMIQSDGKVILGGDFTEINGITRINVARLSQKTAAQNRMTVSKNDVIFYQLGSAPLMKAPPTVEVFGNTSIMTDNMTYHSANSWTYQHNLEQSRFFTPTSNYDFTVRGQIGSGDGNGSAGEVYFSKKAFFNDLIFKDGF